MWTKLLNQFIFYPQYTSARKNLTPKALSLEFEDVTFRTRDGLKLTGWYILSPTPRHTVLYCHGNAGNRRDWLGIAPFFVNLGCNILIWDYRGYGDSQGTPSERGLYWDGDAVWEWFKVRAEADGLPTSVLGKSLGSTVAIHIASTNKAHSLILDSAFASMYDLVRYNAAWVPPIIIPRIFESQEKVSNILAPTLLLHGDKDTLIPLAHSIRIYLKLESPKALVVIKGAGHNTIHTFKSYEQSMAKFLSDPLKFIANKPQDNISL